MLNKNDILRLEVLDINYAGLGVAKQNGAVIFVQNGVTGDTVDAKIIKVAKNYCVARIEELISPSPYRTEPDCVHFKRCGGCTYRHITYEYEKELKKNRVKNEFIRAGLPDATVREVIGKERSGYRNKLQCPVSNDGKIGFYAAHTHDIVPIDGCVLQEKLLSPIFAFLQKTLTKEKIPELRHIYLRCGAKTGEVMVCFVSTKPSFKGDKALAERILSEFSEVKSVILNHNPNDTNVVLGKACKTLAGKDTISDILCGLKFEIHPLSFYQVNRNCTELLYRTAAEMAKVKPDETLLDLYCGIGSVGLCINSITPAKKLIGVEIIAEAVENARKNAVLNGITNAEFICSPAEKATLPEADVIVIDPPRKGCAPELINEIAASRCDRVLYISCSPDTLARDCALFEKLRFTIGEIQPVNMFPGTEHIETVVLLSREKVDDYIKISVHTADLKKNLAGYATYPEIKEWVLENYGLKVSSKYIGQIKSKCGLEKRLNYNIGEGKSKELICPPEKEKAIIEAFKHFGMIK